MKNKPINGELTVSERQRLLKNRDIQEISLGDVEEIQGYWEEYLEFDKDKPEGVKKHALGLRLVDKSGEIKDLKPIIKPDEEHEGFFTAKTTCTKWIDKTAWEHLQKTFDCVDILHSESSEIKIDKDAKGKLKHEFIPRIGQFSFETKDVYHSAAFHGSANYIFENPNGQTIKMRGYELKRSHEAWMINGESVDDLDTESFIKTERYDDKNNPGRDFMIQLLENPHAIKRQETAIKEGILKIAQYQDCIDKYNGLGIEPGDTIKKAILMQEFSMTQFTFKTYEQFMGWYKVVHRDKDNNRQSVEGFFLNADGTLNFVKMAQWAFEAIQKELTNPYEELDPHNHKERANKRTKNPVETGKGSKRKMLNQTTNHPYQVDYERVKDKLNGKI